MHDKRLDIQGLRAWAVIAVVIFHFFPSLFPYGYFGVDVFFVLSGFLISMVLEGRPKCLPTYCNFYFKRLRRILPLALLIVLLCIIVIAFLVSGYAFSKELKSAEYSMFFIKNFQPRANAEEDYFYALEHDNDFFTHFWSLCVEIQFYLIAPFLLHLCKPSSENVLASFLFMTVIATGSIVFSLLAEPEEVFDSTAARLWQFVAGAMAFHLDSILWRKESIAHRITSRIHAMSVSTIFIVICTVTVLNSREWENILRFITTFVATLLLVARSKTKFLCHSSLQLIGDVSYSLYLIHWPIVCTLDLLEFNGWHFKVLGMCTAIALSVISYYSIELRYLSLPAKKTFVLVTMLYILSLSAIGTSTTLKVEVEQSTKLTSVSLKLEQNSTRILTQSEIDELNAQLSRENKMWFRDCKVRKGTGNNPFGFCDLKEGNGTLSFLIMGNSYVANLGGLVQQHFKQHYQKIMSRAITQCEPLVPTKKDPFCPNYKPAHATFDADVDREHPDVLFLIARYISPNAVPIKGPVENDSLFKVMEKRLSYFEERVKKKVFILHAFTLVVRPDTLEKQLKRKGLPIRSYMPEGIEADSMPMKMRVQKLAERCKKCILFDLEPAFLNEDGNFTAYNPQKLRYFDYPRHLNALGKKQVEPIFVKISNEFNRILQSKYPENII